MVLMRPVPASDSCYLEFDLLGPSRRGGAFQGLYRFVVLVPVKVQPFSTGFSTVCTGLVFLLFWVGYTNCVTQYPRYVTQCPRCVAQCPRYVVQCLRYVAQCPKCTDLLSFYDLKKVYHLIPWHPRRGQPNFCFSKSQKCHWQDWYIYPSI